MREAEFTEILRCLLSEKLQDYEVSKKESILYKIIVNHDGKIRPENPFMPSRGNLAFETDLLIKKNGLPIVVCEIKYGGFSTHDILTYSSKALKHKEVYPYLRYGLIVGGEKVISNKFFTHNEGFDFAFAIPNLQKDALLTFLEIIKVQIKNSELLLNMFKEKNRTVIFNTRLEFTNP